jgi:hypothetical protein
MKKLKDLKCIHTIFVNSINELDIKLQDQLKNVKQEYQKNVINEKMQLLIAVCNGEGLNLNTIKIKYLKASEISKVSVVEVVEHIKIEEEELLDKIEIDGEQYYYEAKDNGIIYNQKSISVGVYKDNEFILN